MMDQFTVEYDPDDDLFYLVWSQPDGNNFVCRVWYQ